MVLLFWCRLTQVVLEKRPLNECSSIGCDCFATLSNLTCGPNFVVLVLNTLLYVLIFLAAAATWHHAVEAMHILKLYHVSQTSLL